MAYDVFTVHWIPKPILIKNLGLGLSFWGQFFFRYYCMLTEKRAFCHKLAAKNTRHASETLFVAQCICMIGVFRICHLLLY